MKRLMRKLAGLALRFWRFASGASLLALAPAMALPALTAAPAHACAAALSGAAARILSRW
jgi:hypothetical protein